MLKQLGKECFHVISTWNTRGVFVWTQAMYVTKNQKCLTEMGAKTLASSFVDSQFNYCAIVWIFCSRKSKLRLENN